MKVLLMRFIVLCLNILYLPFGILPLKDKVTFISRQSNDITLDYALLVKEIESRNDCIRSVVLTKKISSGIFGLVSYSFHMLTQMYHISTSKVIILDGYCIVASVLKHKKGIKIVQIWHALGAIKCFGYQALDKEEGSSSNVAKAMRMHCNYDYVFCASKETAKIFSLAFNTPIDRFKVIGMPRVDYIANSLNRNEEIYQEYPCYKNKKTILYIPTFRKDESVKWEELVKVINFERFNLIIKSHSLDSVSIDDKFIVADKYNTYDLMKFADYIITDYSATAIEAAILDKPVYFYLYDYDNYVETRGINIDPFKEMPLVTSKHINDIIKMIENNEYDFCGLHNFKSKYVETLGYSNVSKITDSIMMLMQE